MAVAPGKRDEAGVGDVSAGDHRRMGAPARGSTGAGTACAEQLGPDSAAAAPGKRRRRGVTGDGGMGGGCMVVGP